MNERATCRCISVSLFLDSFRQPYIREDTPTSTITTFNEGAYFVSALTERLQCYYMCNSQRSDIDTIQTEVIILACGVEETANGHPVSSGSDVHNCHLSDSHGVVTCFCCVLVSEVRWVLYRSLLPTTSSMPSS